jgi:uncharacterized membrane protein
MYLTVKMLHIVAVVLFLGNIVTGLFWHAHAARRRDPALLAHTLQGIIRSDRLFTMPGVVAIIATGVAAAMIAGFPILGTGWILWSLLLFGASGVLFAVRVAPLQRQLHALAQAGAAEGGFDYAAYRSLALRWELWGAAALATPLAALVLMVLKPAL